MINTKKCTSFPILTGLAVLAGCLLAGNMAQAQLVNLLYIPLTNAPGTLVTNFPSSTSLGGASITLSNYNGGGALTNLAGLAGSGVNGAANSGAALCLTNWTTDTDNQSANNNAAADCAADKADVNLAFAPINNFIVTFWYNEGTPLATTGNPTLPRLFNLNAASANDDTANSIAMKFQLGNQYEFEVNAPTATTGNSYNAPANTASMGTTFTAPPANKWEFFAVVYDGTNLYQYTGSDSQVATLAQTFNAPGLTVNLGSAPYLFIGNRGVAGTRGLFGWMEDFRFYTNGPATLGPNATLVENIRKAIAPHIPTITGIYPDGTALQQATNTFTFIASSASGFNLTNFDLKINSVDVTSSCTVVTNGTGSTNLTVSYAGLPQQSINTAVMTATDALGLSCSYSVSFDTFNPTNFMIKAEEFDHDGGQFIDNPDYTDGNPVDANSYYGLNSVEEVDTHKGPSVGDAQANDYRYDDGSGTQTQTPLATGELPVPRIVKAPLDGIGNPQQNHMITYWSSGEWQNYTKTFPSGNYNVWARFSTSSGSTVNFDHVTSGQGTTSQTTSRLGQFTFSNTGAFQWVELMQNGSPAVINLGGTNTVRATTGGGANVDLYMLVPANSSLPIISNVNPNGAYLFQYPVSGNLTFTASSSLTTINPANVTVTVNGSPVSVSFSPNADAATLNCTCHVLQPNQTYAVTIHVMDDNSGIANANLSIDTWEPVLQIEAEDFDFDPGYSPISAGNGLRFIDNPVPTSVPTTLGTYEIEATNSYEGQRGDDGATSATGVDQFGIGAGTRPYRPGDVATAVVVDTPRVQFANNLDYNVGFLSAGAWWNYTRTYGASGSAPAGTYNLYGRMASGANASGLPTPPGLRDDVSQVVQGLGTPNQLTTYLGTFTIPTTNGYSSYSYYPLIDQFGNYAQLNLSGVETLRSLLDLTTTTGLAQFGLNINFYMLTAARMDQARIDAVYPNGNTQQQQTNTLFFIASSPTYGINTTNVDVTLNGVDISSNLVFSGSSASWNVSYTGLQRNTQYTAVITVTDNNGQTHTTTVTFDTFSPSNFTWEAEDYDFDPTQSPVPNGSGLRYIDHPALTAASATNSYYGQEGDGGQITAAIDYADVLSTNALSTHVYRPLDYVSIEVTSDTLRQQYRDAESTNNTAIVDYDVNWLAPGGWINYTRTFPTGNFYLLARLAAGNGAFNLGVAQVTNGFGTSTQMTNYLGSFKGSGTSFATWQDVYLTDANTNKIVLPFGGVETLQITGDYNENANYFELVPLPLTPPAITASTSGSNIQLSFPTQTGYSYTMYYKNNLTDPSWTQLGSAVTGNGSVQSVSDSRSQSHRFYRLTIN